MMSNENTYIPFPSKILKVIRHTKKEYTFVMEYHGDVKPGQFFEVSVPKFGEAPISVSGIGNGSVDLTIRRVGRVTNEVFEKYEGQSLLLRGPYGNGFDIDLFKEGETVVVAGGTGVSPCPRRCPGPFRNAECQGQVRNRRLPEPFGHAFPRRPQRLG